MPQNDITGEFHVPMVLRQFFIALEHKAPLRPGPVGLTHCRREGTGLIATDTCEVVWEVLLQLVYRLPDLRNRPVGAEFGVAVTVELAPSQGRTDKVTREPNTVCQNGKGGIRIGHIVWTPVDPLVSQGFDNLYHSVKRTIDIRPKLCRVDRHGIPPYPPRTSRHMRSHQPARLEPSFLIEMLF
jgi:hypothetical protein